MKKNILLILTFIISFILLIDNAYAAKELTCRYNHGSSQPEVIVSQDKNGNRTYWTYEHDLNIQYAFVEDLPIEREQIHVCNNDNGGCHLETVDTLNSCPKYLDYKDKLISLREGKGIYVDYSNNGGAAYTELNKDLSSEKVTTEKDITNRKILKASKLTEEEKNNMSHCKYENGIEFYIDESDWKIYSTAIEYDKTCHKYYIKFTKYSFRKYYKEYGCPGAIYRTVRSAQATMDCDNNDSYFLDIKDNHSDVSYLLIDQETLKEEKPAANVKSCSDLFEEDLVEEINKVMNIIRIAVPILLIIFGIVDFFKATFDNNEDEMKKDRERFIKRIIAAIIVFLVPIFVNLVLTLGNTVWSNINADTCINETGASEEE